LNPRHKQWRGSSAERRLVLGLTREISGDAPMCPAPRDNDGEAPFWVPPGEAGSGGLAPVFPTAAVVKHEIPGIKA